MLISANLQKAFPWGGRRRGVAVTDEVFLMQGNPQSHICSLREGFFGCLCLDANILSRLRMTDGGRFAKIGVVKLKCYYKPVGAFFERPPVFVNDPYEQGNGFPSMCGRGGACSSRVLFQHIAKQKTDDQ